MFTKDVGEVVSTQRLILFIQALAHSVAWLSHDRLPLHFRMTFVPAFHSFIGAP